MRIKTSTYADFHKTVNELFGGRFKSFYGTRRPTSLGQVGVVATDNHTIVRLNMVGPLPESFSNEFSRAKRINDIDEFDLGRINTSTYDDFIQVANEILGGGFCTFYGNRRAPHLGQVGVVATDNHTIVRLNMVGSLPESFSNEFSRNIPVNDIDEFDAV